MKTFVTVVNPGEGYRLLSVGETLLHTDEVSQSSGPKINRPVGVDCRRWQQFTQSSQLSIINNPVDWKITDPDSGEPLPFGYYRRKI